ncbi:hypothetical protein HK405_015622, partial [Cladochytrium tenue]
VRVVLRQSDGEDRARRPGLRRPRAGAPRQDRGVRHHLAREARRLLGPQEHPRRLRRPARCCRRWIARRRRGGRHRRCAGARGAL